MIATNEEREFTLMIFLEKNLTLPLRMIVLEPMITCVTLYNSFTYGVLYLFFAAIPIIFEGVKGWTPVEATLPFVANLAECLMGALINYLYSNTFYSRYLDRHGGKVRPEMRLISMMFGGIFFPLGFFMLGWLNAISQLFGLWFIGMSFLLIFQAGINYLLDAYTNVSVSAIAANTILRSSFAAGLPLVGQPLLTDLGVGPACSLLGGISVLLGCIPFVFFFLGPESRKMSRLAASDLKEKKI